MGMDIRTYGRVAALTLGLTAWAPAAVWACASGLLFIPTAETTGAGQWCFDLQVDGRLAAMTTDATLLNFEAGLGERFELGADWDISDGTEGSRRLLLNAKWVFVKSEAHGFAAAAGVWNTSRNFKTMPFLVGTKEFGELRLHAGATRSEAEDGNRFRAFVGADRSLGDHAQIMADYTAGDENYASAGFGWTFGDHASLLVGIQHPNAGGGMEYTLHFVLCGGFRQAAARRESPGGPR